MVKTEYKKIIERIGIIRQRNYDVALLDARERVKVLTTNQYELLDIIQIILANVVSNHIQSFSQVRKPYRKKRPDDESREVVVEIDG